MNERRHIVLISKFRMLRVAILVTVLLIVAITALAKTVICPPDTAASSGGFVDTVAGGNPIGQTLISCPAPGTPSLVSPDSGQTGVSTSPTLDWSDVTGATSYDVQVCSDIGWSSVVAAASVYSSEWTVSPALDQGTRYYWRVRASNSCGSSSWSNGWDFTTSCATLDTPSLVVPYDGQTGLTTTPTLYWSDVSGATSYYVQVCSDIDCSSVVESARVYSSQWEVSPALYQGARYYWRVKADKSCGSSSWSSVWSFTTCAIPGTPGLVSPDSGQTGVSTTPTLDWSDVSGATSYDVEVCSDSGCSSVVGSASVNSSQWTVSPGMVAALDQGARFYWHVRANNSCGSGSWSNVWSFTTQTQGNNPASSLDGVWGSSSSDVFAVGYSGTILHYDGSAWSAMTSGTSFALCAVWGSSSSDVFAVGSGGTILHYNGSVWSAMTSHTTNDLLGVWGNSSSNVFAVGNHGTVLHYNGSAWSAMISHTTNGLNGIWGSSSSDIFAAGSGGTILHYNGSVWGTMNSSTTDVLWGVWGSSSFDVFAVGNAGNIMHYDGSIWSNMTSGTNNVLWDVWGSSYSDVFAVGNSGTVLRYNGSAWSTMISGTSHSLYSVWVSPLTDVFAVGAAGIICRNTEATTTTVASSANPSVYGQSVTFTATVSVAAPGAGTPTGTVQFQIDGSNFGSAVALVDGIATSNATAMLSIGSHTVTAVYSGDINFTASTGTLSGGQEVSQAVTITVASSANPSVYGQSVTFTATVSVAAPGVGTPTGTVQFQIDGSNLGSAVALADGIATSNATATLSIGSHTVTAVYSGDINFAAGTGTLSDGQKVNQAITTTVASSANPSVYGQSVTFTATVSPTAPGAGVPTGTVIFKEASTVLGSSTLSNGTATYSTSTLSVGKHSITAVYGVGTNLTGSTSLALTQTVNAAPVNWGMIGGIIGGAVVVIAALVYFLVIKRRARRVGNIV